MSEIEIPRFYFLKKLEKEKLSQHKFDNEKAQVDSILGFSSMSKWIRLCENFIAEIGS